MFSDAHSLVTRLLPQDRGLIKNWRVFSRVLYLAVQTQSACFPAPYCVWKRTAIFLQKGSFNFTRAEIYKICYKRYSTTPQKCKNEFKRLSLFVSQRPIVCGKEWQYSCKRKVSTIPGLGYTKFVINAALQRPKMQK